jgi:hypothetical protein
VVQQARNLVMDLEDAGTRVKFVLHDRDGASSAVTRDAPRAPWPVIFLGSTSAPIGRTARTGRRRAVALPDTWKRCLIPMKSKSVVKIGGDMQAVQELETNRACRMPDFDCQECPGAVEGRAGRPISARGAAVE